MHCDVSAHADVDRLADAAYERHGAVHILFNNAGVAVAGPTVEMSHADWEWLMAVNLWGPIHGVEAFLPRMVAQGTEGHVLFTASFAGLTPNVGLGPYCVTKYGVVALAEVLQKELRANRIGVSVLCPIASPPTSGTRNATDRLHWAEPTRRLVFPTRVTTTPIWPDSVLPVEVVAADVVDAIKRNRLYIVPHAESRPFVRRRFDRIDAAYDA